jgi:hypothetical protein
MTVRTSTGRAVKVGSIVRVIAVPPIVLKQSPRITRKLFKALVGQRFKVRTIERDPVLLELEVSTIAVPLIGGSRHTVYIEPEFVA